MTKGKFGVEQISMLIVMIGIVFAFGCGCAKKEVEEEVDTEKLMTQQSDSLTIIESKNGGLTYHFYTLLMERYEKAKEPYMEFRKGVKIITYQDSTQIVESTLVGDYAIFLENQKLWEVKGNVVTTKGEKKLETQQLFWNQKTKKIYSNVDSKVTMGSDVIIGIGFEANEDFSDFTVRRPKGKVAVDVTPTDSTAQKEVLSVVSAPQVVVKRGANPLPATGGSSKMWYNSFQQTKLNPRRVMID